MKRPDPGPDTSEHPKTELWAERAAARQAVVMPILRERGWTRGKWATDATVGNDCVYEYLKGKRNLNDDTRRVMAESIGLKPQELPD
jgi:hypothetical protein